MVSCVDCKQMHWPRARGLCRACHDRHRKAGTLCDFPVQGHPGKIAHFDDYAWLRKQGATIYEAARRAGVTSRTGWRYEKELRAAG